MLVVKRKLLPAPTEVPSSQLGGGTVFYVTEDHHRRAAVPDGSLPCALTFR